MAHQLPIQSILSSGKSEKINKFVLDHINDLVAVHRLADLNWEYVNPALQRKLGYSCEELYARNPLELVHPDDVARVVRKLKAGINFGQNSAEFRYLKKDGSFLWLQASGTVIEFRDEEASLVMICREIVAEAPDLTNETIRDDHLEIMESQCQQLDRTCHTLRKVMTAITAAENEADLLDSVCQAIVEAGRYTLAWVGFKQAGSDKVQPVAHAGQNYGYLAKLNIHLDDPRRGWGPTGIAIRTGQPVVSNHIKKDEKFAPWVKDALRRGYKSNFTLPLQVAGTNLGVLSVYGDEVNRFDQAEQDLLQDIAGWLAYGLASTRNGH